jgi:hydrogenase maturation protease
MIVLVTGFGNLLQRDDGFGVNLLRRLQDKPFKFAGTIRFVEVGIGGITLVQELLDHYDALIVLDAVEGETPGEIKVLEVAPIANDQILKTNAPADNDFHHQDRFADIHYAEPGRAIALAHEIGRLPPLVYLIGCVPKSTELGSEMSPVVENAIETAVVKFWELIASFGLETLEPVQEIDQTAQDVKLNVMQPAEQAKATLAGIPKKEMI